MIRYFGFSIMLWGIAAPLAALDITPLGQLLNGWPVVMASGFILLGFISAIIVMLDN